MDFTGLTAEIATEVQLLHATRAELTTHVAQRQTCHRAADPAVPAGSATASSSAPVAAWPRGLSGWEVAKPGPVLFYELDRRGVP